MIDSPAWSYNSTCKRMNKGLSCHDWYQNNHGYLLDLRPKMQVFKQEKGYRRMWDRRTKNWTTEGLLHGTLRLGNC